MAELKNLIREYPELGDVLAEYENRLAFLEASQLYSKEPGRDTKFEERLTELETQAGINPNWYETKGRMVVNLAVDKHSQHLDKRVSDLEDRVQAMPRKRKSAYA
jgi:uncharacterized coiled-coil protein SlyX